MIDLKPLAEQYFETFSRKDLDGVAAMFHDDVSLTDWENIADGKEPVVAVYKKIFDSVNTIKVVPLWIYQDGDTIAAQLHIFINETEIISVADFLDFKDDKIICVTAYKG